MKKVYFNTLAILTIVLLIVGNFIFISNKKSNANTITTTGFLEDTKPFIKSVTS